MTLTGIVTDNLGVGHRTIARQKPFFRPVIPGVDNFRNGTINVRLAEALGTVSAYDYYIAGLRWDNTAPHLIEDFGFIKVNQLVHGAKTYAQWGYIYFPSASPNRADSRLIELVGANVPDLHHGDLISINIDDNLIAPAAG